MMIPLPPRTVMRPQAAAAFCQARAAWARLALAHARRSAARRARAAAAALVQDGARWRAAAIAWTTTHARAWRDLDARRLRAQLLAQLAAAAAATRAFADDARRDGIAAALRARLREAPFQAAVGASILLHAGVLSGLLALHRAVPRDPDNPPIVVTVTAQDPARLFARAGVDWDSDAALSAITALLEARRSAALIDEVVITPPSRPRPPSRAATAAKRPAPAARPTDRPADRLAEAGPAAPARPEAAPAPPPAARAPDDPTAAPPRPIPPTPVDLPVVAALAAAAAAPPPPPQPVATPVLASLDPAPLAPPPEAPPPRRHEAHARPAPAAAPPSRPTPPVPVAARAPELAAVPVGGPPRATAENTDRAYFDAVYQRILQHIRDDPNLARRRIGGRVLMAFTVARDGTVLNAEIRESSGYGYLDQAGLDLIRRASPMPALPASVAGEAFTMTIPIRFRYD
jgi:protein TonB